ncbi:hypothetical protein NUM3379_01960 [Kineococcus sp. NUM-3379]
MNADGGRRPAAGGTRPGPDPQVVHAPAPQVVHAPAGAEPELPAGREPAAYAPAYGPVDLTTCDREPIHVPGAVQPHGVLLAVDPATGLVVTASQSCAPLLGVDAAALSGQHLRRALGPAAGAVLARPDGAEPVRVRLDGAAGRLAGQEADVLAHRSGTRLVVEVEPVAGSTGGEGVSYRSARAAIARLTATSGVDGLCRRLAAEVRDLTGFDRVMVYRFDAQWNGEVVAEERREDLNSFLGLHYPATDIPAQARRLYTLNWTRLIADVSYRPSPLVPVLDPGTGAPLDLSHSVLRSVSPIHVEYLHNMGVTASMSISLLREGELWGLVACHHYAGPHRPAPDARSAAELLGQVASQLIADRERAEEREATLAAQDLLAGIVADLAAGLRAPAPALLADPRLLRLVGASGAALWDGEELLTAGSVPDRDVLHGIAAALARADGAPASTDSTASLLPGAAAHAGTAAGALRTGLGTGTGHDRWLLWLRPEQVEVVDWGGDPHNKRLAAAEGPQVRLSPRRSFEKWREVVRGRSLPWSRWHAETAERLGNQLNALVLGRVREHVALAESLQRAVIPEAAPHVPGVEVVARYRPAQGSQLGGDWWDALYLPDGRVAFVVGDVAGHGVHAATTMAQLRTALRVYLLEGHPPAASLDRLDRLVAAVFGEHMATAVIAVFDPATGAVELTNAGHTPPVRVGAAGAELLPAPPRPLLGVGMGTATSVAVRMAPGDVLLLFTDGLVERRGDSLEETLQVLVRAASAGPAGDLAGWADGLLGAVPGAADDDATLLAVRLGGA